MLSETNTTLLELSTGIALATLPPVNVWMFESRGVVQEPGQTQLGTSTVHLVFGAHSLRNLFNDLPGEKSDALSPGRD